MTTDQLTTDLQSGDSLSSLAATAGVSNSDLLSSVETDLKANAPQGTPALSDTQLASMATDFINGVGPGGSTGTGSASTASSATSNLNALAEAAGVDPTDLLHQIASGDDLSQLLGSSSQTSYGSTVADSINGGVIFDQYA